MSQEEKFTRTMPFIEHIDELRSRLVRCAVVFFLGFLICYGVAEDLLGVLRQPLFEIMPEGQRKLYFTSLFENFMTHLKISGYASIFFFSPYFFYQLWSFVAPGMYQRERRLVIPFVLAATLFFLGGACFAYFVLFPVGFKFFVTFGSPTDVPILTIDAYYSTCLKLLLLFGLAFELPVLVCLLGVLGVVDAALLRRQRKAAFIGITVASAMFAPPDAISMLLLMVPMVLLYEGSILVVQAFQRRRVGASKPSPESEPNALVGRSDLEP